MALPKYNLDEYLQYVSESKNKRLLVEGDGDYQFFSRFIEAYNTDNQKIDIDDARFLIDFGDGVGNREKVETVFSAIKNEAFAERLVCFSDRDYRGFSFEPDLEDSISCHQVNNHLIWTRGHSIENYYFDFEVLYDAITSFSSTRYRQETLVIFRENFGAIIEIASTLSLLGMEFNMLKDIRGSIDWEQFKLLDNKVVFDLASLEKKLIDRRHIKKNSPFKPRFLYWKTIVDNADVGTVRWVCHGHIGITVIWNSFEGFVFAISQKDGNENPRSEVGKAIGGVNKKNRLTACATAVVNHLKDEKLDKSNYPFNVLNLLEVV